MLREQILREWQRASRCQGILDALLVQSTLHIIAWQEASVLTACFTLPGTLREPCGNLAGNYGPCEAETENRQMATYVTIRGDLAGPLAGRACGNLAGTHKDRMLFFRRCPSCGRARLGGRRGHEELFPPSIGLQQGGFSTALICPKRGFRVGRNGHVTN